MDLAQLSFVPSYLRAFMTNCHPDYSGSSCTPRVGYGEGKRMGILQVSFFSEKNVFP